MCHWHTEDRNCVGYVSCRNILPVAKSLRYWHVMDHCPRHTDSVRSIVYVLLSVQERQAFWICVKVIQAVVDVLDAGSGKCVRSVSK